MNYVSHTESVCSIWGIADDVLRHVSVRGKKTDALIEQIVGEGVGSGLSDQMFH